MLKRVGNKFGPPATHYVLEMISTAVRDVELADSRDRIHALSNMSDSDLRMSETQQNQGERPKELTPHHEKDRPDQEDVWCRVLLLR